MVKVSGVAGLYHFSGQLVSVPASGEASVDSDTAKEMFKVGFKEVKPKALAPIKK